MLTKFTSAAPSVWRLLRTAAFPKRMLLARKRAHLSKWFCLAVLGCAGFASSSTVHALPPACNLPSAFMFNFGNILATRSGPVGEPLGPEQVISLQLTCNPAATPEGVTAMIKGFISANLIGSPLPDVWKTLLPGVGMRLTNVEEDRVLSVGGIEFDVIADSFPDDQPFARTLTLKLQFVRTETIIPAGGTLNGAAYNQFQVKSSVGSSARVANLGVINSSLTVHNPPTCVVDTGSVNIPVDLKLRELTEFSGVGTGTSWENFKVTLDCRGGDAGTSANVHITLTDAGDPTNRSDVLGLTAASVAKGVGVQLARPDDTLINFGPDSDAIGNPGQWQAGIHNAGGQVNFNIPMKARYVQTESKITPGTANAVATFTMAYD